ncbi:hypothetical protein, variant [Verruconis gallopava]|nr:hypothetical protein, variant [Verruconis gallopava]KIW09141.1 hypothetical protein, variant [Verruconis gallopava]
MKLAEVDPSAEFAIVEESDDDLARDDGEPKAKPEQGEASSRGDAQGANPSAQHLNRAKAKRGEALKALQTLEIMALSSCFLSPAAVAYMLHKIRPYLSRPSGGVVSNSNLTLFVLAAELRPVLHFFRLVEERTLHLQRIVSSLPASDERQLELRVEDLTKRVEELTSMLPGTNTQTITATGTSEKQSALVSSETSSELEGNIRQSLQPQLDALNRAVRRYEKRATTQAIVTEARLQDLEAQLKDALSLAAAASRQSQKSGLLTQVFDVVRWMLTRPLEALSHLFLLPFQLAGEVWRFLVGPRRKRKKAFGMTGSHAAAAGEGKKWAGEFKGKASRVESR